MRCRRRTRCRRCKRCRRTGGYSSTYNYITISWNTCLLLLSTIVSFDVLNFRYILAIPITTGATNAVISKCSVPIVHCEVCLQYAVQCTLYVVMLYTVQCTVYSCVFTRARRTHAHTQIHTYTYTHTYTYIHKHTHTIYTHLHMTTYTHTYIHLYTNTHTHAYTRIHTHTSAHTALDYQVLLCIRLNFVYARRLVKCSSKWSMYTVCSE